MRTGERGPRNVVFYKTGRIKHSRRCRTDRGKEGKGTFFPNYAVVGTRLENPLPKRELRDDSRNTFLLEGREEKIVNLSQSTGILYVVDEMNESNVFLLIFNDSGQFFHLVESSN
jgi:hypothetical protein